MADKPNKKKLKGFKEFDPSKYIETEPTLDEAAGKTAVISFGRMNPVTVGHEKLVSKVASEASKRKADAHVFLSHSQDKKKNPLSYEDKIRFAQKAFGNIVKKSPSKTIIQIAQQLQGKYKDLVLVVGSDRVKEFDSLLNKYNGKDYSFDSITVVSAGDRDPDSDDVSGMSASKMRAAAAANDTASFKKGLPKKLQRDADTVLHSVQMGMGMSEEVELDEALTRQQRRKRALAMKRARFKIKRGREKAARKVASTEVLKKRARKAALGVLKQKFAKNRRYAELSAGEKEVIDKKIEKINKKRVEAIARKLFPKVKAKERERHSSKPKNESVNEASCVDTKVRQKPHMLLNKEGKVKFDGRFKLYKKKVNESAEDLYEEINDLMESTEQFNEGEKKGLWDNIHAKRKRIKAGSGEKMRKPGSKGAPTDADFKAAAATSESTEVEEGYRNVMTTHDGETFKSKLHATKKDADDHHWKMTKATDRRGKKIYKSIETVKEESELEERSTGDAIKAAIGKVVNRKNYKSALEYMKKSGKSPADVARIYRGIDARTLANMAESLEESRFGGSITDREKRAFKRKEHEAEWKREQEIERKNKQLDNETHHVYINKKIWKKNGKPVEFENRRHAKAVAQKLLQKDPKKKVHTAHHTYNDRHGGVIKEGLDEVLTHKTDIGTWVKDFQDSDAPQFKGKSKEKRKAMAIAAALDAKRKAKNEEAGAGEEGTDKLVKRYKKDTPNA